MILIDTHVLVWLDEGNPRLGELALDQLNLALAENTLAISAISFWEISMLVIKQRLTMKIDLNTWHGELLKNGLKELPITGETGLKAGALNNFHGDPADRLIVATALLNSAELFTADEKILAWPGITTIDAEI